MGNCLPNVLNALHNRHLTPYPVELDCLPFDPYLYRFAVYAELRDYFWDSYQDDDWHANKTITRRTEIARSIAYDDPKLSRISAHIKTEVSASYPKKARLIQAFVNPVDNYLVADHYRAFTHALLKFTLIPRFHCGIYVHVRSACGLNRQDIAAQIGHWLDEVASTSYRVFCDDVSNMDGSVQLVHLQAQQELYEHLSPELAHHHGSTFSFKGMVPARRMRDSHTHVTFSGDGRVKSGAQDTSSGQTCRRIDGIVRCFSAYGGVVSLRGFVFGDDVWLLVVADDYDETRFADIQLAYGFRTKGVFVREIEHSEFLSCTFAWTDTGVHMFPKPGRQFAKLFWTWRRLGHRQRGHYISQIAESVLPAYRGFTFMEHWLGWHLKAPIQRRFLIERPSLAAPIGTVDWDRFVGIRYGLCMPSADSYRRVDSCCHGQVHLLSDPWADVVMSIDLADLTDVYQADTFLAPIFDPEPRDSSTR